MEKVRVKFIVDALMFLDFLVLAFSGFVLWKFLKHDGFTFRESFIFARWQWINIHDWTALILVILIVIHLLLNWAWIKCMFLGLFKKNKPGCKV